MLTALAKGMKLVNQTYPNDPPIELHTIPQEDPGVYDMICAADTIGVFQIESRAQMSMLPRLKPRTFYDLVIEVAIVRPGPIQGDMVHPYLRRRSNLEAITYPTPEMEAVLGRTLGVPLFQEQAMRLVMVAARFSADQADQLRRAMAAWRYTGHIDRFQQKVIDGMTANGYTREFAEQCFNQIKGFGEYGFPESHAASFALLVYASAWVKRYHPAAFCCAILNAQPMGFYAPAQLVRDAREHGVEVRGVDINHSDWDCTLEPNTAGSTASISTNGGKRTWGRDGPAVRLGLRMVKGFATAHAERIMQCRRDVGRFQSIEHFHETTALPVSAITKLSAADAFASVAQTRRLALWETLALPEEQQPLPVTRRKKMPDPQLPLMTMGEEIQADYTAAGLSLKGHPVQMLRAELAQRKVVPAAEVWNRRHGTWIKVAGLVIIRQRPGTAKGIVFATLEDETGIVNLIIRPDVYERYRPAARSASMVQADGYVERQGEVLHVMAMRLHDLSGWLGGYSLHSRDFH
jgi:error-prone DNA polymerase